MKVNDKRKQRIAAPLLIKKQIIHKNQVTFTTALYCLPYCDQRTMPETRELLLVYQRGCTRMGNMTHHKLRSDIRFVMEGKYEALFGH